MESKKCRALLTAVECGSLTAAAAELGYTQAGLTNMMNSLEAELGLSLLVRRKTGVSLTADGQRLLPQLRAFAEGAEALEQEAAKLRERGASTLRVGAYSSVARHWLPPVLESFRRELPEVEIMVVMGGNQDLHRLVRDGELDCAFVSAHPSLRQGLEWLTLRRDPLLAVLPADAAPAGASYAVENFEGAHFLMPSLGFDLDILPVFETAAGRVTPQLRYTNLDDAAIVSMVEHGLGVTILSELVMRSLHAQVLALPLEPAAWREIGIVFGSHRQDERVLRRFLRCAQDTLEKMYGGE